MGYTIYNYTNRYDPDDFVGLTIEQIIDKYGPFDRVDGEPYEPYFSGGYLVNPAKKGFLGTKPPKYYMIFFDENGIALGCHYEEVV